MGFSMFLVGITIVCAGICHYLAKRKGFKPSFWIIMGACLGPLPAGGLRRASLHSSK